MFCSNCGTQIPDGSAFCPNCGTKIGGSAPTQNTGSGSNQMGSYQPVNLMVSTLEAEDGPAGDEEPGSLPAQDGPGRLCGAPGTARAEGAGVSDALFQQQLESADPPRA